MNGNVLSCSQRDGAAIALHSIEATQISASMWTYHNQANIISVYKDYNAPQTIFEQSSENQIMLSKV